MQVFAPTYYKYFSCIADKCRHSCCIGWEIDIDEDTLKKYSGIGGTFGERLNKSISREGDSHFVLDENERCPFLNKSGLCDIISECGEANLCDICADHPRFRNFYSARTETGLGLCCEAAAKLIIGYDEPFALEIIEDDGEEIELYEDEKEIIKAVEAATDIAQCSQISFEERCNKLLDMFMTDLPDASPAELAEVYMSLERLDPEWDACLDYLGSRKSLVSSCDNVRAAENLLCYFLYRHLPSALDDGLVSSKAAFAVLSSRVIMTLAERYGLEESARMYSAEIEYSEENKNALFDYLA